MFIIWVISVLSTVLCENRSLARKTTKWPYRPDLHAVSQNNIVTEEIEQKLLDRRVVISGFNTEDTESKTTSITIRTPKLKVAKLKSGNNPEIKKKTYFTDNFVRFLNVAISKDPEEVMKVLKPGRNIAVSMQKKNQLLLAEGPIGTNFYKFLQKLCYESYNYIKKYLTALLNYMQNRLLLCSVEFNKLIDFIETLYEEQDGGVLNKVIGEFERFPEVDKSGDQLSQDIIEAFLRPSWKNNNTKELENMALESSGIILLQNQCSAIIRMSKRSGLNRFTTSPKNLSLENRMDMLLKSYHDLIKKDQSVKYEQNRGLKRIIGSSTSGNSFNLSTVLISLPTIETYSFKPTKKNVYRNIIISSTAKMPSVVSSTHVLQSQWTSPEEEVEGNFCLAYIKFTGELMTKKPSHLRAIVKHADKVIKGLQKEGKLKFLGKIEDAVCDVFIQFFHFKRPERINNAEKYYRRMVNRKTEYDEEINEIFDFANDFVTSTQAEHLYEVVDEIHAYPRVNKTAETLCREVFKAIVVPFSNAANSIYFKNFLPEVTSVLRREYPEIFARVDSQHEEYN